MRIEVFADAGSAARQAVAITRHWDRTVLVLEDPGGVPLDQLLGWRLDLASSFDSQSDLYALGVTLYEIVTGSLPFTASDPMEWVKDLELRYVLADRAFERRHDVRRDQIRGKTDFDIYPDEVAEAVRGHDGQVIEAGAPIQFEKVVPSEAGDRSCICAKFLLRDRDGKPCAVCGIATDITERQRAEDALHQAQTELSLNKTGWNGDGLVDLSFHNRGAWRPVESPGKRRRWRHIPVCFASFS